MEYVTREKFFFVFYNRKNAQYARNALNRSTEHTHTGWYFRYLFNNDSCKQKGLKAFKKTNIAFFIKYTCDVESI